MNIIFYILAGLFSHLFFGYWGTSILLTMILGYSCTKSILARPFLIDPIFLFKVSAASASLANIKIAELFRSGFKLTAYNYAKPEFFDKAALIWFFGILFLISGFESTKQLILPKLNLQLKNRLGIRLFFLISFILSLKIIWMKFSLPGTLNQFLGLVPVYAVLYFTRTSEFYRQKENYIYSLVLTLTLTTVALFYAYLRTDIALPFLVYFLGILSVGNSRLNLFNYKLYPVYVFVAMFFVFFQIFGSNRSTIGTGYSRISDLISLRENAQVIDRVNRLSSFERGSTIGQLSAVCGLIEKNGSIYSGSVSEILLSALIPRFLWPEKPKIAFGVWFAYEIGNATKTSTWYNNSVNMTVPGNLFLDFGWIGLILGCFFFGKIMKIFWLSANFYGDVNNLTGNLFGGYMLFLGFAGFGADLQSLITILAIYLIINFLDKIFR